MTINILHTLLYLPKKKKENRQLNTGIKCLFEKVQYEIKESSLTNWNNVLAKAKLFIVRKTNNKDIYILMLNIKK